MTLRFSSPRARSAFTIVEAVFAMGLLVMLVVAICAGISFGSRTVRMSQENTRATQILIEKTEQIRLYNWDQLTSPTNCYVPTNQWLVRYYSTNVGAIYTGQVAIGSAKLPVTYSNDMREVTITLRWETGGLQRSRSLTTYVSRYGVQNYIY